MLIIMGQSIKLAGTISYLQRYCLDIRDQSHKLFPKVDEKDPN